MTGAQSLLETALHAGVDVCFANPGTTEMDLVGAFDRVPEMRTVLGLFEGVCTGMADGYGRMTGHPALTLLHLGVGLGNGIANLHNANRARTPIVNLIGDHPTSHLPYDAPLTSDIATMAQPVSHLVKRIESSDTAARAIAEAIAFSQGPPGRISTLIAPADCMRNESSEVTADASRTSPTVIGDKTIGKIREALLDDAPCALLLGDVALLEKGLFTATRIGEATGARVMAEAFPSRLDRGAGIGPVERIPYFPELVLDRLKDVRRLILVGAKAPVSFFQYPEYPSSTVPDTCEVLTLARPEDDVLGALEALAESLNAPKQPKTLQEASRPEPTTGELNSKSIGLSIANLLPEGAVIADEAATSGGPAYYLTQVSAPHSSMYLTGGGIGWGLPAATGAAIARPDSQILALQGDGGGMYTLQAMWTQAREGLNVTNIIFSNRKYAILQVELGRAGIENPGAKVQALTELSSPEIDWCSLAKGMGVPAERPDSAENFHKALERALAEDGPHLIEAVI